MLARSSLEQQQQLNPDEFWRMVAQLSSLEIASDRRAIASTPIPSDYEPKEGASTI